MKPLSNNQPPALMREKYITMIETLLKQGTKADIELAQSLDKQYKVGYFEEQEKLKFQPHEAILDQLITQDKHMLDLKNKVRRLINEQDNVHLFGESGTGKELLAKALHGTKSRETFVDINCAGLPESLIEAELFGYAAGSFTGALKEGRMGLFQKAEGGTLFLDEVGELPFNTQAKLLRVLQERRVRRVGALESEPINCRIITATHHPLDAMIKTGGFRLDLYFRIATITLKTIPLRQRIEDIPLIVSKLDENSGTFPSSFSWASYLATHELMGNVRELQMIVRRYQLFQELPKIV